MSVHAINLPQRRGACPGLSAPMLTGDGLLVRLMPVGTIPLAAFAELCAAARRHGNGVIEITSRGSIQIRGLNAASAPRFEADIAALAIAAQDGIPILCNPLAGLDAEEILNSAALAADLRRALAQRSTAARVAPKVSIAIDGGGGLGLETIAADIRLGAEAIDGGTVLRIGVGGDGANAAQLGTVAARHGVEATIRLLDVLAQRGRKARARDILAAEGIAGFRSVINDLLTEDVSPRPARRSREAIGTHRLRDGSQACGIGVAFGHADAASLEHVIDAAQAAGAAGARAAPGRVLMIIGLTPETLPAFAATAEQCGFIVRADDPRRHVVACAGAPICISAQIASRAIAPRIAEIAAPHVDGAFTIHVSGCTKGCAHAAPAALSVVGTPEGCALIADGSARAAPFALVGANDLPDTIANYLREQKDKASHA
jgi:precorrin-3B synthase